MPILTPPPPALRVLRFCIKSNQIQLGQSTGIHWDSLGFAGTGHRGGSARNAHTVRNAHSARNACKVPALRTGATVRNTQRYAMRAPHATPRNDRAMCARARWG